MDTKKIRHQEVAREHARRKAYKRRQADSVEFLEYISKLDGDFEEMAIEIAKQYRITKIKY